MGKPNWTRLAARYQMAPPPPQDHRASMWYRMRLLTLDWSENFKRLALYLSWRGDQRVFFAGPSRARDPFSLH